MPDLLVTTFKLILAIILGWLIGFEREASGKAAGTRTYALVTFGSTLFTILATQGFNNYANIDPTRMVGQIIVGIGFIGAGLIIFHKQRIEGLTTAAALWASSAIGITIGIDWYWISLIATALVFVLLYAIGKLEYKYLEQKTLWGISKKKSSKKWWF